MPKASDADKERFGGLIDTVAHIPGVEVKPMFGQLGAFVNGNMFAGLFGSTVGVKLDEADTAELRSHGGGPFGPRNAPWVATPPSPNDADAPAWTERAAAYVATLPPKPKKK